MAAGAGMHYRIFELWRFSAALLVMGYHYLHAAPADLWHALAPAIERGYALLDLFFMISGFLVLSRYRDRMGSVADYLHFLRRRVAVLYPLHLFTLAFFVAVALAAAAGLFQPAAPERWDLGDLPAHLLLVHAWGASDKLTFNIVSWSISAEFFAYALFPLVLLVARRGLPALLLALCAYVALLEMLFAAGHLGPVHWTKADVFGAWRALASFTIGAAAFMASERFAVAPRSLWPAFLLLTLAIAAMLAGASPYLPLAAFALAIILGAAAERAHPQITARLAPLMPLLRLSFGIYLWHMVFDLLFNSILWRRVLDGDDPLLFLAFQFLPVVATIAAAALSRPFEKRLADRLCARPAPGAPVPA
ncbi:acyltransferase family protein [Aureimonas mangrovi]|uniref:acyltransferase family protein n=1 Tax=Aureimonas mangrovi TaxID=2758041 RepID=UPI00163D49DD|nr:acyltransferase [Aureimonas mangrovi]